MHTHADHVMYSQQGQTHCTVLSVIEINHMKNDQSADSGIHKAYEKKRSDNGMRRYLGWVINRMSAGMIKMLPSARNTHNDGKYRLTLYA